MHLLGRTIKVTMQPPGGQKTTLLDIENWDYNWQETYFLKEPIPLKVGTTLHVEAVYDNSDSNPNNPNSPPKLVTLGEQTTNEMCFVFLGATSDFPGRSPFARPYGGRRRLFDHLRRRSDGKTTEPQKSDPSQKDAAAPKKPSGIAKSLAELKAIASP
jgi:Copper type II ascorbate-dependent monooxygenase, C-terminal domain